jgi:Toprim-like
MAHILDLDKIEGLRRVGPDFVGRCPVCALENRDKSKQHLSVQGNGVYNCIADKEHNKGIYQLIGVGGTGIIEDRPIEQPRIECIKTWDIGLLDKLIQDFRYFEWRGISAATQKRFNMGVALTGQMANRVVIPLLNDHKTQIIGFTGRSLNNEIKPKWRHLGSKTNWIMCGDVNSIQESRTILITEGPADILALYEAGIKNTLCLFGTTLSSKQLGFLIKNNPLRIVIGLNNEPDNKNIGNLAAEKLRNTLRNYFSEERLIIGLPEVVGCKDFNDMLIKDRIFLDEYKKKWLS